MTQNQQHEMDRRVLLKSAAVVASGISVLSTTTSLSQSAERDEKSRLDAYPHRLSYEPGDEVEFHVSTSAEKYHVEIARIGVSREVVRRQDNIEGKWQPTPANASTHGCQWPGAFSVKIPRDWRSGYYSATFKAEGPDGEALQSEAFFVVRALSPGKKATILLQLSTHTYNAYNDWGGSSLYVSGSLPLQGHRVSFERPFARGFLTRPEGQLSDWSPYAGWHTWERPFVAWAEGAGYDIEYAVNSDLEEHPEIIEKYQLVLSVGHDEYWSAPMRDHLEAYIALGGNVAFFSGNVCYWQVRSEDDGAAIVGYKFLYENDPYFKEKKYAHLATLWSNKLIGRPENQLTGVSFNYGGYHRFGSVPLGAGGYTIQRPEHWVFAGTDLKWGDQLGTTHNIVGYECDGCEYELKNDLPVPTYRDGTPEGFQIVATAPARLWDSDLEFASKSLFGDSEHQDRFTHGAAIMGLYTRGGTVFTTGCTEWSRGLEGNDPKVIQITKNVLDRLSMS